MILVFDLTFDPKILPNLILFITPNHYIAKWINESRSRAYDVDTVYNFVSYYI